MDDSKLHPSFLVKDMDGAARQITEDLRKVAAWCCQHSLLINADKTKLLLTGTRQMLQNTPADLNLHVTLLGKELRPVVSAKALGVYMDATLSFDENLPLIDRAVSPWNSLPERLTEVTNLASFKKEVMRHLQREF